MNFNLKISLFIEDKDFIIKTASTSEEVRDAMKLRHRVYYEEMLNTGTESGLDFDRYDPFCDHLLVIEKITSTLVGTYRLNTSPENDFYSSDEFDLTNIFKLPGNKMELGRACVHPDYRKGKTLQMLVKGFLTCVSIADIAYLFGCSSITMENKEDFLKMWNLLVNCYKIPDNMNTPPVNKQEKVLQLYKELPDYPFDHKKTFRLLSPLMILYLKAGSLVSPLPFYDEKFNCFDFFTILDMKKADRKILEKLT